MLSSDSVRLLTSAPGLSSRFDDPDVVHAVYVQLRTDLLQPLQHGFAAGHKAITVLDLCSFTEQGNRGMEGLRWDTEEHCGLPVSLHLSYSLYSLNNKEVIVNELCPLLIRQCLWCLQARVYVIILQTLQELSAHFECDVNHLGGDHWSRWPFALFLPFWWQSKKVMSLII